MQQELKPNAVPLPYSRTQIWPSAYVPPQSKPNRIIRQLQNHCPPNAIATEASTSGHSCVPALQPAHYFPRSKPAFGGLYSIQQPRSAIYPLLGGGQAPVQDQLQQSLLLTHHHHAACHAFIPPNNNGGSHLPHRDLEPFHLLWCNLTAFTSSIDAPSSDCSSFAVSFSSFSPLHVGFNCSSRLSIT